MNAIFRRLASSSQVVTMIVLSQASNLTADLNYPIERQALRKTCCAKSSPSFGCPLR